MGDHVRLASGCESCCLSTATGGSRLGVIEKDEEDSQPYEVRDLESGRMH